MLLAGRNGNGVTGSDLRQFVLDAHSALACRNEINLLGPGMVVFLRAGPGGQTSFRQALLADGGVAVGQQFADFGAVLGEEGRHGVQIFYFHTIAAEHSIRNGGTQERVSCPIVPNQLKRPFFRAAAWLITYATCCDLFAADLAPAAAAAARTNDAALAYMRVVRPGSNTVELQIAVRKFVPAGGAGPVVWLSGASHVGDSNYFRLLQKHLDAQGLVLFEGIKDGSGQSGLGQTKTVREDAVKSEAAPAPKSTENLGIQQALADSLGLVFQLEAIDYARTNFRNSDLSIADIQRLLRENAPAEGKGEGGGEFAALLQVMDGSSFLGMVMNFGVRLLGSSPKLQALTKLTLIETLGQVKGDISQIQGLPPEMKKLVQVLIQSRNQAVLQDLATELKKPVKSISIFYGAGHMSDMEQRLKRDFHYRPAEDLWLTAIALQPARAGVTETEQQMIRSFIKWQMEALKQGETP